MSIGAKTKIRIKYIGLLVIKLTKRIYFQQEGSFMNATRNQSDLYEQLLDSSSDLIMVADIEDNNFGEIVFVNKAMSKSFKTDKKNLIGKNIWQLMPKNVTEIRKQQALKAMKTKKPLVFEDERQGRYFSNTFVPILNQKNQVVYGATFTKEITTRKLSEMKYQSLVDNMNEGLFVVNKSGRFTYINKIMEKRSGYSEKEYCSFNFIDFVLPEYKKILQKRFDLLLQGKEIDPFELGYKKKNGDIIYVEVNAYPLYENKKLVAIQGLSRDITENVIGKQKIIKQEKYFTSLIQNSMDLISVLDKDGKAKFHSPSIHEVLGYEADELIGKKGFDNIDKSDSERVNYLFNRIVKKPGSSDSITYKIKNAYGDWRYLESRIQNKLNDKNIQGIILNTRDITEIVEKSYQLREAKEYLNNVIGHTNEIIFTINKDKRISLWNESAERVSNIKGSQIIGKPLGSLDFIENLKDFADFIDSTFNNKKRNLSQIIIKNTPGLSHILKPSISFLKDENEQISDIIFICKDITYDIDSHGQLLSGSSYFLEDEDNSVLKQTIIHNINKKQHSLFITRGPVDIDRYYIDSSYLHIRLFSTLSNTKYPRIYTPEELKQHITDFISKRKHSMVLIDRLDYLFNMYGFQKLFFVLCEINDIIKKYQASLIVRINKSLLSSKEYSVLKEEFMTYPSQYLDEVYLDATLFEILSYVHAENGWNKIVNQNKIVRKFNISKLTAQKRISALLDENLLISKSKGRSKHLFITKKGTELIEKTKNVT